MMINSPLLNQDEKLNLLTCDNNSPDRHSDNQHNSTIKTKIRNSRLSLSDLSLTKKTQPVGGGGPSELSYRLPDPSSPISAFEINLSTQSNNSQSSLNRSLNQDQICPMYHQPKDQVRSGLSHQVLGQTVDPKPLPDHNLPQRTLTIRALPPSEHPESNRSNTPGKSQPEHLPNHQLSSKLEIKPKNEESEDYDDVLGNEELYSAQTHLSPKDEILPTSGPLREALPIIVQDSNWDDLIAEPVKLQSSEKNSHQLRAFTISVLKNGRNLTVNSSRSSSSSISEVFHQLLPCSSTPVSNMLTNGISLIKSPSLKSHSRPLKQSVKSPVFMSTKSFNNSLDLLQSSQSHSSDIIRPGNSHASEWNHTGAVTFLSGSNLVQSPENLHNQHLEKTEAKAPKKKGKEVGLKFIERIKCKQTGEDEEKVSYLERLAYKDDNSQISSLLATSSEPFHLSALKEYMNSFEFSHDPIDLSLRKLLMGVYLPKESQQIDRLMEKVGDLPKERDRASAKAQKSGGSKINEMVRIIKEQALKFEEERHWLTSKLVKLTSSNQVLEREVEAEVKYGPYRIPCMPLKCNLIPGVDCGW
ncbi:hypothetical protein PPACK8108_LOCUS2285 [Phakopsora pachyrhizi]|uniref:SEC7 domain-containing protein n=1 Tax=Phakopsora pachyrhizi TaxID=170000 RepID=A0AAV0AJT7_PHAPC|nr:hypothetical protein PPACK8108_LOCUS2285 [Phakopsora pachyrhizi]